jgi:hypothetical protein
MTERAVFTAESVTECVFTDKRQAFQQIKA